MTLSLSPATHLGLSWRPLTTADLASWHALVRDIEAEDRPSERYTVEDLQDDLENGSWKDPAVDSVVGLDGNGVPVAFGHVEVRPGDTRVVRAFCWGGVHPAWRGRGIGSALLRWQEEVARRKVRARPGDAPGRMVVQVDEHLLRTRQLLERSGLAPARWYVEMTRPLDAAHPVPRVPVPPGYRVEPYSPAWSEQVRVTHNVAFADHWGSEPRSPEDWQRATVGGRAFRPDWSHVALHAGDVVGYTVASAYPQDWAAQGYTSGWTDLVGVLRAHRGRGLAPALLTASMRGMTTDGMERADLGVDSENGTGALGVYTRLGYRAAGRTISYTKEL